VQNSKLTPPNLVILAGGAVMFIASFLPFYKLGSHSDTAWSSGEFLIATLPVLFGLAMAAHIGLVAFAKLNLPDRVLGLTWTQVHLALGFQAAVMMLCFLVRDPNYGSGSGGIDRGVGLYLMLLAAIALLVGAVMRQREGAPAL
jgi:hypothetical protein